MDNLFKNLRNDRKPLAGRRPSKSKGGFDLQLIMSDQRNIFEQLLQKYLAEIASFLKNYPKDENGNYEYEHKDKYFSINSEKNGDFAYFIKNNGAIVGFVLVTRAHLVLESIENNHSISEIFIVDEYKNQGFASLAVKEVLKIHKGNFEVKPFSKNPAAVEFWKKVIIKTTNGNFEIKTINNGSKVYVFKI